MKIYSIQIEKQSEIRFTMRIMFTIKIKMCKWYLFCLCVHDFSITIWNCYNSVYIFVVFLVEIGAKHH